MAEKRFELTTFQLRTPGLYTGDPLTIEIDWQVKCTGFLCFSGWQTVISAVADGHPLKGAVNLFSNGNWGGKVTALKFVGTMPPHDISVNLSFLNRIIVAGGGIPEVITRTFTFLNLDEFPPPHNGDPDPGFCTEGETRCQGNNLMVCSNSKWIVKEVNSFTCGYVPPQCFEGTTRCIGTTLQRCTEGMWKTTKEDAVECGYVPPTPPGPTPPGPDDEDKWAKFWKEYQWWIIGGLAAIAIAVLVVAKPWKGKGGK